MHFTIITPSFSQLTHLKRCIASVADQVGENFGYSALGVEITGKVNPQNPEPSASITASSIGVDAGTENLTNSPKPQAPGLPISGLKPKASISIHHHIQDAGSTDGTQEFLKEYESGIRALGSRRWALGEDVKTGVRPSENRDQDTQPNVQSLKPIAYSFSFASEVDDGMYDAINKGIEQEALGTREEMGGSNELLATSYELKAKSQDFLTNGQHPAAQNPKPKGQSLSRDSVIAWLNCDEQYLPGTLQKVADFFASNPDVDLLFGGMLMVDAAGELLACRKAMPMRRLFLEASYLYNYSCAMFFRESLWRKLGGFDTSFKNAGDEDLIRRALELKAKCYALNDYLATFTYSDTNLSSDPAAVEEHQCLKETASLFSRAFKLPINLLRLLEKFIRRGHVQCGSVEYELYQGEEEERTIFKSVNPSCRWPDEKKPYLFGHRLKSRH